MKKARLFLICALILSLAALLLVGCSKEEKISSVYLKDYTPESVIDIKIGDFDYSAYTLVVAYDSGRTEELTLTEEMIDARDVFKFYQEGEHTINVLYSKHQCTFKVAVKRSAFGTLAFPENNVFTYDGKAHVVEVEGELPSNAVVTYPGGNSFINAGTYDVVAIVSCEGYVTERLATTVKIEKAKYDMSGVKFESASFVYDGKAHSVRISGALPEGVTSPTYVINERVTSSATDVGEYLVTARFTNNNANYEPIPDMHATLTITPAEYVLKDVDLVFKTEDGERIDGLTKVYDGKSVRFDISDYSKLSSKITVSFSIYDEQGNIISASNKNTKIVDAGLYTVKVEFTLADSKNYKPIDPIVREFVVSKADYNMSAGIHLDSDTLPYDGIAHSVVIDGALPAGVSVRYEYYLGETLIVDDIGAPVQAVADTGRYTVMAIFAHDDPNFNEIAPLSATLYITKATLDVTKPENGYMENYVYDGEAKSLEFVVLDIIPEGVEITYEYYLGEELVKNDDGTPATAVTEVGEYTVKIIVNVTNPNYMFVNEMSTMLIIIDSAESE